MLSPIPLVPLLRLSWLAATLPILAAALLPPLRRALATLAARGKTMKPSPSSPFFKSLTLPQSYFLHFYLLAVAVTTFLLACLWLYAYGEAHPTASMPLGLSDVASHLAGGGRGRKVIASAAHGWTVWRTVFLLLLMEAQVVRRLYETRAVFDYSSSARMHVVGYLTGLFFYTAAPLSLASACLPQALSYMHGRRGKFIVKGREKMPPIEVSWWGLLEPLIKLGWRPWIGSAIFLWGWIHQLHCHVILGSLRDRKGSEEYVIPHGDWFEYVSCPHYLTEIVIYAGILIASGGTDLTIWLLFFFVVANLVFAAAETHRWYHQKFESYPQSRRAIIPFIY